MYLSETGWPTVNTTFRIALVMIQLYFARILQTLPLVSMAAELLRL
jgi:hypothetical protein